MYNRKDMKIQVIRIEPYDNISSLLDKVNLADAPCLVLDDTGSYQWLSKELALKQILRKGKHSGRQIGMITSNLETRSSCQDLEIQTFEDIAAANNGQWKDHTTNSLMRPIRTNTEKKITKPKSIPETEISRPVKLTASGIFFLVLVSFLVLVIPSSHIKLSLFRTQEHIAIPVQLSSDFSESTISGNVPASIHSEKITIIKTNPVTQTALIPIEYAQGSVIFTNMTDITQEIPFGTLVATGGVSSISFETMTEAILEGKVGSEVEVPVMAREAGEVGNVTIGEINQINSLQGTQMKVRNDIPLAGGLSRQVSSPGALDRNTIRAEVLETIRQKAIGQFGTSIEKDRILLEPSFMVEDILVEEYYPDEGRPGTSITLEMTVAVRMASVSRKGLADYLDQVNALSLSDGDEVAPTEGSGLALSCQADSDQDIYSCIINGEKETWKSIQDAELFTLLRGQPVSKAQELIDSRFPQVKSVEVEMNPNAWPWFPYLSSRIFVKLQ